MRRPALAALTAALLLAGGGCAHSASAPAPAASASPAAAARLPLASAPIAAAPLASPPPRDLPTLRPIAAPSSAASPRARAPLPRATAVVVAHASAPTPFGILRPHDRPQIYSVSLSTSSAGGGDLVSGIVVTSSNVASVVASVAGISSGVPKAGVGRFVMSYRLPAIIPPFIKGAYTIVVTARNVDGVSTSSSVPISLH